MSSNPPYVRIQTNDQTLNRIQSQISAAFNSVSQGPFQTTQGNMLSNVPIGTSQTQIAHGLGVTPNNVFLGCPNASSTIHQSQAADSKYIYLTASTACVLSVWVS